MNNQITIRKLNQLANQLEGELRFDHLSKILYSTDASVYREVPLAVSFPKSKKDIRLLIEFARNFKTSIIPRGAGTSLAGQVVGQGIVVDVSKHLNKIFEVNVEERWARVGPGVVLAELNMHLQPFGLMFGPETSSANRCTMGGMLGNNSCGLHSLVHGSVRDHILEITALLSDGSEVKFKELAPDEYSEKLIGNNLENRIYQNIHGILSDEKNRFEIADQYPDPSVPRRNNGYAIDIISRMQPFNPDGRPFNFSKLIAGSEGTLAFVTDMKLNLIPLPPQEKALLCAHFHKLTDAFQANLIGLKYEPSAIELMDKSIMDMTKGNIGLNRNRFFIEGDPGAILIIEFWGDTRDEIISKAGKLEADMLSNGLGFHFPLIWGNDIQRVWALRTGGLGVLSNLPGDAKPVAVVEDTAIPVFKLPEYMGEFKQMLDGLGLKAVYQAHIATGELHVRPVLNLKDIGDIGLFKIIATETAKLVKKYNGSLSGEHGDGRLRGEFIPFMLGDKVYQLLKGIKKTWDPNSIFNPGKITDTPPMNQSLRYEPGAESLSLNSYFDYKIEMGMARAIEKCNGSGDCLKSAAIGGTMCPSYMAAREEINSTRGRANVLRELITKPGILHWADQHEVIGALDLCLSCKACKSECPSGIDMTKLKADFLQNHYNGNHIPFRTRIIANFPQLMGFAFSFRHLSNGIFKSKVLSNLLKVLIGFTIKRPIPLLSGISLISWFNKHRLNAKAPNGKVYLFNDEFLDFTGSHVGISAILLLEKLGYEVVIPKHAFSGRTYLSKGFVKKAKKLAETNILLLKDLISVETPLIGIEPSAILTFRDEYPELVRDELKESAKMIAPNSLMFDEFIVREIEKGKIRPEQFTEEKLEIRLHGHCHQKSLATTDATKKMLQLPANYKITEIPSGCCGMAGSFGYEKEHYKLSMEIGEMVLFPAIRSTSDEIVIAAPGISCREQIEHGTGRKALHPVEILYNAFGCVDL